MDGIEELKQDECQGEQSAPIATPKKRARAKQRASTKPVKGKTGGGTGTTKVITGLGEGAKRLG